MTQRDAFQWHQNAGLFAGSSPVVRPPSVSPQGFRNISQESLEATLGALGAALIASDPFCVSDHPLPEGILAAQSEFFTLTGGSTGCPKIIRRTQASWTASFDVNRRLFSFGPGQSVATLGHLGHSLALYAVVEALHLGMNAYVLADVPPSAQRAVLSDQMIETLYATPTQLRMVFGSHSNVTLPHLRRILCGGGTLDAATRRRVKHHCPNAALHQFYGAAETSFITMTDDQTPIGSVGKPYPNVTLIIDAGEVFAQSPYLFTGYASHHTLANIRPDGFVSVGEMGTMDADGNLWLKGRKTRMITVADQSVYPEEIEQYIMTHIDVGTCAVLPVHDPVRGQRLAVVLEAKENATLTADVKKMCRARFGALTAPRHVHYRDTLPRLASGKTDLTALAAWLEGQT